jgi:hypothetical protein
MNTERHEPKDREREGENGQKADGRFCPGRSQLKQISSHREFGRRRDAAVECEGDVTCQTANRREEHGG